LRTLARLDMHGGGSGTPTLDPLRGISL